MCTHEISCLGICGALARALKACEIKASRLEERSIYERKGSGKKRDLNVEKSAFNVFLFLAVSLIFWYGK